eukprot:8066961-Prorocentrum_lima.AAC.1
MAASSAGGRPARMSSDAAGSVLIVGGAGLGSVLLEDGSALGCGDLFPRTLRAGSSVPAAATSHRSLRTSIGVSFCRM